jgi:hypothetical protein
MLTDEHHVLTTMIDQGVRFDQIENYINSLALAATSGGVYPRRALSSTSACALVMPVEERVCPLGVRHAGGRARP